MSAKRQKRTSRGMCVACVRGVVRGVRAWRTARSRVITGRIKTKASVDPSSMVGVGSCGLRRTWGTPGLQGAGPHPFSA